jgi:hypothetical protein
VARVVSRMLVTVAAFSLMLPVAPVVAQEVNDSWQLTSEPVPFRRGGDRYLLEVSAFDFGSGQQVQVTISQRRDPKGPRRAEQRHSYTFAVEDALTFEDDLSSAKIDTGEQLGKYGRLDLAFSKDGPLDRSCGGDQRSRTGTLSGTLQLKTGTALFGVIDEVPGEAEVTHTAGLCGFATDACPPEDTGITGFADGGADGIVFAQRNADDDVALIGMFWSERLSDPTKRLNHDLVAELPLRKVAISPDLGSATLRGAKGTWLSGTSTFGSTGPTEAGEPSECGKDGEVVYRSRPGKLNGTLKANSWLGSALRANKMDAIASETVVRRR